MWPLPARVDLGAIATKGYSAFPKLQQYWNLTIRLFIVISRTLVGRVLPLRKDAVRVFYSHSLLDNMILGERNIQNGFGIYYPEIVECHKTENKQTKKKTSKLTK